MKEYRLSCICQQTMTLKQSEMQVMETSIRKVLKENTFDGWLQKIHIMYILLITRCFGILRGTCKIGGCGPSSFTVMCFSLPL